ncbi:MAG: guanine deaminase [Pseudomonadota bacterium]
MQTTLLLGQTLRFRNDPFLHGLDGAVEHHHTGAVALKGGRIVAVGDRSALRASYPQRQEIDHGTALLLPGFVDAHAHYPQTAIIASWGKRLIDWLNDYTFPEEMRFSDLSYARQIAKRYFDLSLSNGITSSALFATVHPQSVDAVMAEAQTRGLRVLAGKVMMDRNAPEGLCDTAQSSYDDSAALITKWHGQDRLRYAITPRFAPTSSPAQLEAAAALWAAHPDTALQTHLSEQREEIAWVRDLFPKARDYLDVYEQAGLLGQGGIFGHAIHLEDRERTALSQAGASIAHCPTSNTFIGSGLFQLARARADGITVGLATDVGGGSSFSMLRTMAAAYEVGQLTGRALHPAELLWTATEASARALGLGGVIGTLSPGAEADVIALDLASTPVIAQRAARAQDVWEALFPTLMLGDDRAISAVYIQGNPWPATQPTP